MRSGIVLQLLLQRPLYGPQIITRLRLLLVLLLILAEPPVGRKLVRPLVLLLLLAEPPVGRKLVRRRLRESRQQGRPDKSQHICM